MDFEVCWPLVREFTILAAEAITEQKAPTQISALF
jgi:hypothetical protein